MAERYATIIKNNEGQEVVSNIAQIEGTPSKPSGDAKIVKVGDGVKIGMIKGGKVDATGGYGFPEGTPPTEDDKAKSESAGSAGNK